MPSFYEIKTGLGDGFIPPVPIPIRLGVVAVLCNLPIDLTAAEAEKIRRVLEAMKPTE
jgi:hypothetical protein